MMPKQIVQLIHRAQILELSISIHKSLKLFISDLFSLHLRGFEDSEDLNRFGGINFISEVKLALLQGL